MLVSKAASQNILRNVADCEGLGFGPCLEPKGFEVSVLQEPREGSAL